LRPQRAFFLVRRPRPGSTLFPYTTLFRSLGVLTLTPYHYWKKTHALHHATSGNLEHRGFGDIDTLTVDEYLARSRWERFKYRVRSEEHTSELQSRRDLVCRLLLEKKKYNR